MTSWCRIRIRPTWLTGVMAVEYAPIDAEALETYFRAFEKAGAMKIVEK